jgi:SAM-dependent methyltransferase
MEREPYGTLAEVYEWTVPKALLTPEGSVAAFAPVVDALEPGARVLDCAAGIGQLAVGLALRGFDVVATDASPAMVARTRALAAERQVALPAAVCRWEELAGRGWAGSFDAVLCVGNSLTHAAGRAARREALGQMASVLRPGGQLVLTSRNWERVRAQGSGLRLADSIVSRGGRRGLVVHAWTIAEDWEQPHELQVAVGLIGALDTVTTHGERLLFWPFTHQGLDEDLRAAGLEPESSTYAEDVERYMVTARGA